MRSLFISLIYSGSKSFKLNGSAFPLLSSFSLYSNGRFFLEADSFWAERVSSFLELPFVFFLILALASLSSTESNAFSGVDEIPASLISFSPLYFKFFCLAFFFCLCNFLLRAFLAYLSSSLLLTLFSYFGAYYVPLPLTLPSVAFSTFVSWTLWRSKWLTCSSDILVCLSEP